MQLGELILRERLGRKQIQRARGRILQDRVQHRRVVTERLARRRRRDRDDVAAGEHVLERFRLMGIELLDAASRQRRDAAARQCRRDTAQTTPSPRASRCAAVTIGSASTAHRRRARPSAAQARPGASGPCRRRRRGGSAAPWKLLRPLGLRQSDRNRRAVGRSRGETARYAWSCFSIASHAVSTPRSAAMRAPTVRARSSYGGIPKQR